MVVGRKTVDELIKECSIVLDKGKYTAGYFDITKSVNMIIEQQLAILNKKHKKEVKEFNKLYQRLDDNDHRKYMKLVKKLAKKDEKLAEIQERYVDKLTKQDKKIKESGSNKQAKTRKKSIDWTYNLLLLSSKCHVNIYEELHPDEILEIGMLTADFYYLHEQKIADTIYNGMNG